MGDNHWQGKWDAFARMQGKASQLTLPEPYTPADGTVHIKVYEGERLKGESRSVGETISAIELAINFTG